MSLDDIKHFRQLDSKCPGHPEYRWTSGVETHHRPARPGDRDQRRHGGRLGVAGGAFQPPRGRALRLRRLRDRGGRLPDGGGLATRPPRSPATRSSPTSAGSTTTTTSRSTGTPRSPTTDDVAGSLPGLRWNVTRVEDANDLEHDRPGLRQLPGGAGAADADHRRLATSATARPTSRTPPRPTASRSATRRSGRPSASTAGPRTREFLVPDGVQEHFNEVIGQARRRAAGEVGRALRELPRRRARERGASGGDAAPRAAGGMGRGPAQLRGRREGHGHSQGVEQGRERGGRPRSPGCWPARRT